MPNDSNRFTDNHHYTNTTFTFFKYKDISITTVRCQVVLCGGAIEKCSLDYCSCKLALLWKVAGALNDFPLSLTQSVSLSLSPSLAFYAFSSFSASKRHRVATTYTANKCTICVLG